MANVEAGGISGAGFDSAVSSSLVQLVIPRINSIAAIEIHLNDLLEIFTIVFILFSFYV
jgi:hypothetical protein